MNKKVGKLSLSCFVSSHGFGHASRVAAVIQSLSQKVQNLDLLIFGETTEWFWRLNLPRDGCTYEFVHAKTDVGLFQNGPFAHDLKKTLKEVEDFLSFSSQEFNMCRNALIKHRPHLVLCDISPLGIILAKEVDIPVLILENFTWDWIYQAYEKEDSGFRKIISSLHQIYSEVDYLILDQDLHHLNSNLHYFYNKWE